MLNEHEKEKEFKKIFNLRPTFFENKDCSRSFKDKDEVCYEIKHWINSKKT